MGDALFVSGGVTSAQEARLALAGLLASQGSNPLDARTGALYGPGTTTLIAGTTATAPMTVTVGVHDAILSRGTANGPYLMPTEAVQTVSIDAAPGSGTRIDVVYEKQQDSTAGVPTPDATTGPLYGVQAGTVGAGEPSITGIVGAKKLGTVAVSAGATNTLGAGIVITNTVEQTVARGARIPVRSLAERDALTSYAGLEVYRLDTGAVELRNAANTAWLTVYDPSARTVAGSGRAAITDTTKVLADAGITDVVTVPAPAYPSAVPWRLVLVGAGKFGFDNVDRQGAWDIDSTPASATNIVKDPVTNVLAHAAMWATVGMSAQMDLPAGVAGTFRVVYRGDGPAYNVGGVTWHRTTVI